MCIHVYMYINKHEYTSACIYININICMYVCIQVVMNDQAVPSIYNYTGKIHSQSLPYTDTLVKYTYQSHDTECSTHLSRAHAFVCRTPNLNWTPYEEPGLALSAWNYAYHNIPCTCKSAMYI